MALPLPDRPAHPSPRQFTVDMAAHGVADRLDVLCDGLFASVAQAGGIGRQRCQRRLEPVGKIGRAAARALDFLLLRVEQRVHFLDQRPHFGRHLGRQMLVAPGPDLGDTAAQRIERAQAAISHTIDDSSNSVKPMLEPLQTEVESLVERTYQLCTRMTGLENYRSVQSFQGTLQADLVRIDTQLASATDEVVKREYEESKKAVQKRVEALNAIGVQSDRIEAQLSSTAAALSGVQAELVRLHALGPQLASQLVPAQLRIVRELTTQLTQFEQEVSRLSL